MNVGTFEQPQVIERSGAIERLERLEQNAMIRVSANPQIDDCHATVYSGDVIKTFADKAIYELYSTGRSRQFPPDIRSRALRRLQYLDVAATLEDLKVPPSNRLHQLSRDRAGQHSISVNDQWRICFRFVDGDAYDVELTDYH